MHFPSLLRVVGAGLALAATTALYAADDGAGSKPARNDSLLVPLTRPTQGPRQSPQAGEASIAPEDRTPATQPARDRNFHVDLRRTDTYLASDALEGRLVGTPGLQQAGDLISHDFSRLGLQTLPGLDGYFQPFEMASGAELGSETRLAVGADVERAGVNYEPIGESSSGKFDAPVVFAGYGITDPARHYDDYAGLDVKGKVVLVLRFEPQGPDGASLFANANAAWSPDATFNAKCHTAVEHGAVALLFVNPPLHDVNDDLMGLNRPLMGEGLGLPVIQVRRALANAMLREAHEPLDLAGLERKIESARKPASAALAGVHVSGDVQFKTVKKKVRNVVAVLPGNGPHADEFVVVGAHYDHLGHGGPGSLAPFSHEIHHGADDNASGTTAMLAIADDLSHSPPLPRSVIFIAFTAEEEGLIGSQHFVSHCPVPIDHIRYMLNLDMVGRMKGEELEIGGAGTAADLQEALAEADAGLPIKLGDSSVGGKGGMGPSDHMSFALKKVPVVFFFTGLHADYHRPSDTSDKINYWGMEQCVRLGDRLVEEMTRLPREEYVSKYDSGGMGHMGMGPGGGHGARLGVVPDYGSSDGPVHGVRLSGVSDGTAAQKAGLRGGDIITSFGSARIDNLEELADALARHKPGDKIKLTITRDGKTIEADATLGGGSSSADAPPPDSSINAEKNPSTRPTSK